MQYSYQQPPFYQAPVQLSRAANRPIANQVGTRFAQMSASFALAQVVVSMTTSAAHQGTLSALANLDPDPSRSAYVPLDSLLPVVLTSLISLLVFGFINLFVSFFAARETAQRTGDPALGQRAGIITALIGTGAWVGLSIVGALISGTDGTLLTTTFFSNTSMLTQAIVIASITGLRAIILGGLFLLPAWLFSNLGAQNGAKRANR